MKRFYTNWIIICAAMAVIVTAAWAGMTELVPKLSSDDMNVRYQAQSDLMTAASQAGRPGAENERKAFCLEICSQLSDECPLAAAYQLVRQLQRIGGEESVPTLTKLLKHPDVHLRDDARQALEVNPSPRAAEPLLAELKTAKDPRWIAGLINSLGVRRERRAVDLIIPYLTDKNIFVAEATVKSLAMMADESSISALMKAEKDAEGNRKELYRSGLFDAAYFSIRSGNIALANRVYREFMEPGNPDKVRAVALIGLMKNNPAEVLSLAKQFLADSDTLKAAVIEAASQIHHSGLNRLIAGKLGMFPEKVQGRALKMLEFSGDRNLANAIVPLLKSANETVRDAAADALSKIGTVECVDKLLETEGDAALNALVCLNVDGVNDHLNRIGSPRANDVLAKRGDPHVMKKLLTAAGGTDEQAATAALKTLKDVAGPEELEGVLDIMLKKSSAPAARQVLGVVVAIVDRHKSPETTALLVNRLDRTDAEGKALLYQALARVGSDEALAPVAAAAKSDKDAFSALCKWTNARAVQPLLEIAAETDRPLNEHVQALRAVARQISAKDARAPGGNVQACEKALSIARRSDEKKAIIGALGKQANQDAINAVKPYLQDAELKEAAQAAIKSIRQRMKKGLGKKKKGGRKK